MAPPVEPAQAPMIMSESSVYLAAAVHLSKLSVAKPVVVMMVTTWKPANWIFLKISPSNPPQRTMTAVVASTIKV